MLELKTVVFNAADFKFIESIDTISNKNG